jgi:hypothetical protein
MNRFLLVTALSCVFSFSMAEAAPNSFFYDLTGSWSGSGQAYLAKFGNMSVNCRFEVTAAETQFSMKGSCSVFVFRQALGLTIKNVGGNKYTGTYTGSKTGPAKLEGTLEGNRLVLNIQWGGVVNGDRTAEMVLERTGANSFAQSITDRVAGINRSTSSINFKR